MCGTCGCSDPANEVKMVDPETGQETLLRNGSLLHGEHDHHGHDHHHDQDHHHSHEGNDKPHVHGPNGEIISLEQAVLSKNDQIAERNRGWFEGRGVLALNLVSSPGAGKTTLLERTIREIGGQRRVYVIEGDQMTSNDAERVRAAGAKAIQINTGAGCHLEADMISDAVKQLDPESGSVVLIENVGNLVCPSMFDLGEKMKVAVISTTEGEDKPLKYPHMFRASEVVVINKMDIAEVVEFDEIECRRNIAEVNPKAKVISVSAKTGVNFEEWLEVLKDN
ncbi:hydrogenase nickel incorporation protein HypB [Pseudaestuariivita atlantica]|uniref:Hydrogenase maturation factor HypB n=2 Tax=Pseudaestuariivita atlantica TaxID=1317121 RepID=A0A0L1JK48_9RHOB|nr:hydrogenase nickel incorporation protein HypB [Pseudaestuariivita atlantica]